MKSLFALMFVMFAGAAAQADVVVRYNQWTNLPHCGGQTRSKCEGSLASNQCRIEFRNSYGCQTIKMYVGNDFRPTALTHVDDLKGEFYVDATKVGGGILQPRFNVFLTSGPQNDTYEQIQYQFESWY